MNELMGIGKFVAESVWHTLPFFLVSIALGVLVQALHLEGMIRQAFSNKMGLAILLATLVGAFSPFCSCTVVPVVAGLLASGVPLAPIMAFWIASPTMDPEILTLSIGILGWPLALTRLLATLLLSLGAGYLTWFLGQRWLRDATQPAEAREPTAVATGFTPQPHLSLHLRQPILATGSAVALQPTLAVAACGHGCPIPLASVTPQPASWGSYVRHQWQAIHWPRFIQDVGRESWIWGKWLLLAFALEALIVRYVPQAAVAQILGRGNFLAVPLAALVGIPLYLTEMSALPIVAGLLAQGMQPGAAIAFLIAGPVTTLPAMTAVYGIVNRRVFGLYLAIGLLGATLLGIIAGWILPG